MLDPAPVPGTAHRLHALDNLRGILMWLGIVLHVAMIYAWLPSPVFWRDEHRTAAADLAIGLIHAFRMPAFFILAGFFVALLAESRGPGGLLRHRLLRLALPFALFWPMLWIATNLAALAFLNRMAFGHWGLDRSSITPAMNVPTGPNTMHLWFLWLLLWFCVASSLLMRLPRRWFSPAATALGWLARRPWGFVVLTLPLLAASASYPGGFLVIRGSFTPPWNEWLLHGVFFAFGLVLYGERTAFFAQFQRRWLLNAVGGAACMVASIAVGRMRGPELVTAYLYLCVAWLWSFAAIGAALRFMPSRRAALGYLSDSAYWVYLVHLPLTILFGCLLYGLPLSAKLKIVINIACTSLVCIGSYELLVRYTWVGVLLNGRRHARRVRGLPRPGSGTPAA